MTSHFGIAHQPQPTATSCGPTVVAMLVSRPVSEVLRHLPKARNQSRRHVRNFRTTPREVHRLLQAYGLGLDMRQYGTLSGYGVAILRVHAPRPSGGHATGWHWVLCVQSQIFDPAMRSGPVPFTPWYRAHAAHKVFYYEVTGLAAFHEAGHGSQNEADPSREVVQG